MCVCVCVCVCWWGGGGVCTARLSNHPLNFMNIVRTLHLILCMYRNICYQRIFKFLNNMGRYLLCLGRWRSHTVYSVRTNDVLSM